MEKLHALGVCTEGVNSFIELADSDHTWVESLLDWELVGNEFVRDDGQIAIKEFID